MNEEERVLRYYVLCNKLKTLIRTGWKDWHITAPRLESVAEHIYGVQMLAIAMQSEFKYDINLTKVISMLAVHELEEIIIGDLTYVDISREEKAVIGHKAVEEILNNLLCGEQIKSLILEFDERKTPEAKFAYYCDKLECDLQARLYDEQGYANISDQSAGLKQRQTSEFVARLINEGKSLSEMWLTFGQNNYNYDENFIRVSNYALHHKINLDKNVSTPNSNAEAYDESACDEPLR